jgi:hypothetical protein
MIVVDDALPELTTTKPSPKRAASPSDTVAPSNKTKSGRWKPSGRMSTVNTPQLKRKPCMSTTPSVKHAALHTQDSPEMTPAEELRVPSRRQQLSLRFDALRSMDLAASHRNQAMFSPCPKTACQPNVASIMEVAHSKIIHNQIFENLGGGCIASACQEEARILHSVFGGPAILPELFEYMELEF